jgi:transcriptional regulator with GAF, ATPase, and Fis domain
MHVDVRVIAATNRNLAEEISHGRFRPDLFYTLNVFPLTLPALRERKEDLAALGHHFCDRLGREFGKPIERLAPGTMEALERYEWPGNIRELENVLQQAIIVATDGVLDLSDFVGEPLDAQISRVPRRLQTLVEVERDHIRRVLEQIGWKIEGRSGPAQALGLRPSTLRTRLRKLGSQRPPKSPAPQA